MANTLSNMRTGMITSGEIVALTSKGYDWEDMTTEELAEWKKANPKSRATKKKVVTYGAPFKTYVEECRIERFCKKSLDTSADVFAFAWGKLCEKIVHNKISTSYVFQSDVTLRHPKIHEWVGTPDGFKNVTMVEAVPGYWRVDTAETVTDIKCPSSLKGLYNLIKPIYEFDGFNVIGKKEISGDEIIKQIRALSKEGEKYYWQLVSNACITGAKYAELIVFMPFYEDLEEIRKYNNSLTEPYYIVDRRLDEELPFIPKEAGIDSVNIIRFEVPQEDKDFLTTCVKDAIIQINAA